MSISQTRMSLSAHRRFCELRRNVREDRLRPLGPPAGPALLRAGGGRLKASELVERFCAIQVGGAKTLVFPPAQIGHFNAEHFRLHLLAHLEANELKKETEQRQGVNQITVVSRPAFDHVAFFADLTTSALSMSQSRRAISRRSTGCRRRPWRRKWRTAATPKCVAHTLETTRTCRPGWVSAPAPTAPAPPGAAPLRPLAPSYRQPVSARP